MPLFPTRDEISIRIIKEQILAKHQKALVSTGAMHLRRIAGKPSAIEQALQAAGATTYVVLVGTNVTGSDDQQDVRFLRWKWPWMLGVGRNLARASSGKASDYGQQLVPCAYRGTYFGGGRCFFIYRTAERRYKPTFRNDRRWKERRTARKRNADYA